MTALFPERTIGLQILRTCYRYLKSDRIRSSVPTKPQPAFAYFVKLGRDMAFDKEEKYRFDQRQRNQRQIWKLFLASYSC
jgi:hypothetical protein